MKTQLRYLFGLLLALGLFATTMSPAQAFLGISIGIAPPPLPVYAQPECPGLGYIWTPGYWAWDADDSEYYWVPGAWVQAPEVGYLWTPGYWGCDDGAYFFHEGYWGPTVGFYGGVAYGHGYYGHGYDGGYWRGHDFYYNRSVNNVGRLGASHTFERSVRANDSRVSYNGGTGGTHAIATADERRAASEHHIGATTTQRAQARTAMADPARHYAANNSHSGTTSATHEKNAFTGESRTAAEEHRTAESRSSEAKTASIQHQSVSHSHVSALASHPSAYHASMFHAPVSHTASFSHAGGFGGGGRVAHASASHGGGGGGAPRGGGGGGGGKHR